jgi:hypothetical protein
MIKKRYCSAYEMKLEVKLDEKSEDCPLKIIKNNE